MRYLQNHALLWFVTKSTGLLFLAVLVDLSARVHEVCSKQNIKTIHTCRCEKDQQLKRRQSKDQQSTEPSASGSKSGKKGRRHSKNSHVEIKAECDRSTTNNALVNGDADRTSSDASLATEGKDAASVEQVVTEPPAYQAFPELPVDVPHRWLCDGMLLLLQDPQHPNNLKAFHFCWRMGKVGFDVDRNLLLTVRGCLLVAGYCGEGAYYVVT